MTASAEDDDGFQVQAPRNKAPTKRIYIRNLPEVNDLKVKLVDFINEKADLNAQSAHVVSIPDSRSALVACSDVNRAISILNGSSFEGNKLVVQREQKKQPKKSNKQSFGKSGWNRPSSMTKPTEELTKKHKVLKEEVPIMTDETKLEFATELELSQHLGSIVASKLKASEEDASSGDVVTTMIASTAAMTLLSSVDAFGLDQYSIHTCPEQEAAEAPKVDGYHEVTETSDFMSQAKKPLSELMTDYGEQDLDFQKVVPTDPRPTETETKQMEKKRDYYNNRLTLQGKAPIHVEVTSFGYMHGVPSDVRNGGWSHAHPLSPFDCRDLPQVPHYMARQDGLSPAVKRALLNARDQDDDSKRDNSVRELAHDIGKQMFDALHEAITAGGYGHASPLQMIVYIGSESGRHRSVVVCERAATALRKLLRANENDQITQPVSVGTRHRDIERRQQQRDTEKRPKSKQMDFESEW